MILRDSARFVLSSRALASLVHAPWLDDPELAESDGRKRREDELDARIEGWCRTRSREEVTETLQRVRVAALPVLDARDLHDSPHLAERGFFVELPHPVFGSVKMQNAFPKMSETPGKVRWPGPGLGEHTDEVLRDVAGLDAEEIARLRSNGVI